MATITLPASIFRWLRASYNVSRSTLFLHEFYIWFHAVRSLHACKLVSIGRREINLILRVTRVTYDGCQTDITLVTVKAQSVRFSSHRATLHGWTDLTVRNHIKNWHRGELNLDTLHEARNQWKMLTCKAMVAIFDQGKVVVTWQTSTQRSYAAAKHTATCARRMSFRRAFWIAVGAIFDMGRLVTPDGIPLVACLTRVPPSTTALDSSTRGGSAIEENKLHDMGSTKSYLTEVDRVLMFYTYTVFPALQHKTGP